MNKVGLHLLLFLVVAAATISVAISVGTAQTCNACNCLLNNVQLLSELIVAQVNQILSDEPRKLFADS